MPASTADPRPGRVQRTADFFERQHLWYKLSRNSPATSCRDAASRRRRLGSEGIPLYDELKSLCVVAYHGHERHLALLHCRATSRFDLEAARKVLSATRPLARLSNEELTRLQTTYGTVTPFAEGSTFTQVFDNGVLARLTPPFTMMTNAGDHTWAIEFRPAEAIEALARETTVRTAHITLDAPQGTHLPSVGILTGNGPESGQALWERVNDVIHRELSDIGRMDGDLSYPRVVVHSVPEMGLSMELVERWDEVGGVIDRAVDQLCAAEVDIIAIACNTTPIFADRIRARCGPRGVDLVTMPEAVAAHVRKLDAGSCTIVGIPVVASLGQHSAYRALRDLGVEPMNPRALPHLQELGYIVKRLKRGEKNNVAMGKLIHVIKSGVETPHAIIALTEISVLLHRFPKHAKVIDGRKIIDSLEVYAEALAQRYLRALPPVVEDTEDSWGAVPTEVGSPP